ELTLPANAQPGVDTFEIQGSAVDGAGNVALAAASVAVIAEADDEAPQLVVVSAPATALPGQTIRITASAVDNVGVAKVTFFIDGANRAVGSEPEATFEIDYTIPDDAPIGTQLHIFAQAVDFSGNATSSDVVITEVVQAGLGYLSLEV